MRQESYLDRLDSSSWRPYHGPPTDVRHSNGSSLGLGVSCTVPQGGPLGVVGVSPGRGGLAGRCLYVALSGDRRTDPLPCRREKGPILSRRGPHPVGRH